LLCLTVPLPPLLIFPFSLLLGFTLLLDSLTRPRVFQGTSRGKGEKPNHQYRHPCIRGGTLHRVSDRANASCRKQHPCRATECQCASRGRGTDCALKMERTITKRCG
jgi:hypothetical protein